MAKLFANSGEPDQTPCSAASDLDLHCLPINPDYKGLIVMILFWFYFSGLSNRNI